MEKERLLDLFSEELKSNMQDKFLHVEAYMMFGKKLNIIYIADDEQTLHSFKQECFKPTDYSINLPM